MKSDTIRQFLKESNAIESEYSEKAFNDALKAWKYALRHDSLNLRLILEIHLRLMKNLLPEYAGKWRNVNVGVESAICPPWTLIPSLMSEWIMFEGLAKKEKEIKQAHIAFERIHPFTDGNGRTGRILLNWMRVKNSLPILIIKEAEKYEYYKWFRE